MIHNTIVFSQVFFLTNKCRGVAKKVSETLLRMKKFQLWYISISMHVLPRTLILTFFSSVKRYVFSNCVTFSEYMTFIAYPQFRDFLFQKPHISPWWPGDTANHGLHCTFSRIFEYSWTQCRNHGTLQWVMKKKI